MAGLVVTLCFVCLKCCLQRKKKENKGEDQTVAKKAII